MKFQYSLIFKPAALLWVAVLASGRSAPSDLPPIFWRQVESPLFPEGWPPASGMGWVSYTFAYGRDVNLIDGERVSPPLAVTTWKAGQATGQTVRLRERPEPAAVQGVRPLNQAERAALASPADVSAYLKAVTALPDRRSPEAAAAITFYRTWFALNGAFLKMVQANHADFIEWVETN